MSDAQLDPKTQEAIDAVLTQDWEKAVELNTSLVKNYSDDVDCLNRLAHAYTELGQINKSRASYKQVLKIDPYNNISTKNLAKLASVRKKDLKVAVPAENTRTEIVSPDVFLEEAGKTKVLALVDIAMPKVLAAIRIGGQLTLEPRHDDVVVLTQDEKRLGKVEAYWASILAKSLRAGSEFSAVVKSVGIKGSSADSSISIFVRETVRSPKIKENIFPVLANNFTPYVREETLGFLADNNHAEEPEEHLDSSQDSAASSGFKDTNPEQPQTSSLETLAEQESADPGYEDE